MKAILARRIERLNKEYAQAKLLGLDAPYRRRSRLLSAAYLALGEVAL